jgi:uncharacterized protein (TIGR02271 family)
MNVSEYMNRTVVSTDGSKIGSVGNVFVDQGTDNPEWITVKTGLFGTKESFVPLAGAAFSGDDIVVPFSKDQVKDAPNFDTDQELSESDERSLYGHYQMAYGGGYDDTAGDTSYGTETSSTGTGIGSASTGTEFGATSMAGGTGPSYETGGTATGGAGHDTSGPNTDDAMTRSEERLHVGTERVEAGRAKLRKYIVTENVTQTVPVSHEEVRIEREPITDANRDQALSGPELSEEEHEVTLTEERVVVGKETVPVERVRLTTDTVQGEQQVEETVRKEQIETDGLDDSSVYPDETTVSERERSGRI